MVVGQHGHHGLSVLPPVALLLRPDVVLVLTLNLDMVVVCVLVKSVLKSTAIRFLTAHVS